MDKKKQHIISIIIGVILASLLLYIGVRVVQQRASRASQPDNFTSSRVDADTCRISATTKTDEPLLLKYGETAATFYFRMEAQHIQPQADSTYLQEADINNLGSGKVMFLVENSEDIQTTCEPFTGVDADAAGGAGSGEDARAGEDPLAQPSDDASADTDVSPDTAGDPADDATPDTSALDETANEPEIMDSTEESTASTDEDSAGSDSLVRVALDGATADAYFKDNPTADFTGCMAEFKDGYYAIVQVCNAAWRAK